jgi:glutaredoxin
MKTIFETFLNEGHREREMIDKLLDKYDRLTQSEKELLKKLNQGASLEEAKPETPKLYTLPGCGACVRLKEWFKSRGIPFKEINIREDREAASYIMNKSHKNGFQQTEIRGIVVVGYDPDRILQLLSKY